MPDGVSKVSESGFALQDLFGDKMEFSIGENPFEEEEEVADPPSAKNEDQMTIHLTYS
ncbi:MAG TPA: hypothetical protein VJK26_02900 [Patescibacteria group bacterium]|nr:hypothetical protein [Patescibacteria group bacterium]